MAYLLFFLLLAVPVIELYVLIKLGSAFGLIPTLLTMIGISLFGAWMLRQQGLSAMNKANEALQAGRMPVDSVVDGLGLVIAAALLMTPGFVTDLVGLALLLPPVRRWLGRTVLARMTALPGATWSTTGSKGRRQQGSKAGNDRRDPPGKGPVIEGEFTRLDDEKP